MVYNNYGYLKAISVNGTDIYTITGMNPRGQLTTATYGNNLNASLGYDEHGFPASSYAEGVQDYLYTFDPLTGNLLNRENHDHTLVESFKYDALERLETVTGPQNLAMQYYDNGNIRIKSDVSTNDFTYGYQAGPYALTGITASTDLVPAMLQSATYTSFEKISTLAQGNYTAAFVYNTDNQRAQMTIAQNGTTILNRIYAGSSYMKETKGSVTKEYTYIGGDAYSAPVAAITQNGATNYFYLLRDYLGNITHVVNAQDLSKQEYSYDAWGRRRNPTDWSYNLTEQPALFADRGFTGHEYLAEFDLYNMNGRLYDPVVGRFLSVDNYVQMPGYTQNFNRYSYALNNPLKFTDPDGNNPLLFAMLIGGVINWATHGAKFSWKGLGYFGIGAAAGALGGVVGQAAAGALGAATSFGGAVMNGAFVGASGGFAGGFVGGAGNAWMGGANFGQGLKSGLIGGGFGAVGGGLAGGITGGIQFGIEKNRFMTIERNSTLSSNSDGSLTPSTKTLNEFSDEFYPDYKFRNKSNLLYKEGYVEKINPSYGAFTDPKMINGRYNIYFSESSFSSKWNLYLEMGHEYIHVAHMISLGDKFNTAYSEYTAYKWNYRVSKSEYFNNQALKYFKPTLYNQATLENVIKPNYMQLGNYGIFDFIPKGLY